MTWIRNRIGWSAAAVLAVTVAAFAPVAGAGESDDYQNLLAEKAPALVTVKFVLKIKMGGFMGGMGDQERESEITGIMINPQGLVLCSNTQLVGFAGMMRQMMGSRGGEFSATPTDIKVLIGADTEGVDAEVIARDTELDLAWVRITDPGDKTFTYVNFSDAAEPSIGQRLVAIRRMDKYFARSAVIAEGRMGGKTNKPRNLYVPTGDLRGVLGLPVYTQSGQVVGVTIVQMPDAQDAGGNPMGMFGMMGNISSMQDMMAGLILPAADVVKATQRAVQSAESDAGPENGEQSEEKE